MHCNVFVCLLHLSGCLLPSKVPEGYLGVVRCVYRVQPMVPLMIFEINCKSVKILEAPLVEISLKVLERFFVS